MYRVFDVLTSRFPNFLWEGCASGGGRLDPGVLQYFPNIRTSDEMDPLDRIYIQFGTTVAYPASCIGANIAASPSHVSGRVTPISFRAHVAMMGGNPGIQLDPSEIPAKEKDLVPGLIRLAEKVAPIIVQGDLWRLQLPEESNFPAAIFVSEDKRQAVLFAFQIRKVVSHNFPILRLQGLEEGACYTWSMNKGPAPALR